MTQQTYLQVYGDKDSDGFYRGESCGRSGYIPCNMVSEIQADDEEMMDQLLKKGFLPLNTPVEKIGRYYKVLYSLHYPSPSALPTIGILLHCPGIQVFYWLLGLHIMPILFGFTSKHNKGCAVQALFLYLICSLLFLS